MVSFIIKQILGITTILLAGLILRYYGIGWDQGIHLHPDERMLIMVADRINFFSNLNPNFFNYGSLPIYILKGIAQATHLANYDGLLYVGRIISILTDTAVIFVIFLITKHLFKNIKIAFLASVLYAISFFPIQNSHFFIVDIFLNLFVTLLVYITVLYLEKPSVRKIILMGILMAEALATKFTAIIFVPLIILIVFIGYRKSQMTTRFLASLGMTMTTILFFFIFMPYAFLSYKEFVRDVFLQVKMNSNAYIFPYTLQYVGTFPYLYYLKNIFLWGLGPVISLLVLIGLVDLVWSLRHSGKRSASIIIFFVFYLIYFLVIGQSAVKFMRYMLPMYPFFAILAGYGLSRASGNPGSSIKSRMTITILLFLSVIWTFSFMNIYSKPNTRITATDWILNNIPTGSTLAIEHWDDRLPLYQDNKYHYEEMTLYNLPDNEYKWNALNQKLKSSDYIIIASNRLYVPLQKLKDCQKYKVCYPKTAQYYDKLFNDQVVIASEIATSSDFVESPRNDNQVVKFVKVAEFSSYPNLEIGNWKLEINDSSADESFTVYDHPKIMIFKNLKGTF